MRILVAGATGAIGRQLLPLLRDNGLSVVAMTHSDAGAAWLRKQAFDYFICDALYGEDLERLVGDAGPEIIINELTAIPGRIDPRRIGAAMKKTDALRRDGTARLMQAGREAGAHRFISQSIAFAYRPDGDAPAVETEPLYRDVPGGFSPSVEALLSCEHTTLNSDGVRGTVLRYGYFYGPGTAYDRDGAIVKDIRRGRFPIVGKGGGVFSFIHVHDAAEATMRAVLEDVGGIFNIVDSDPAPVAEWLPYLVKLIHARPPMRLPGLVARIAAGAYGHYMLTRLRGASNDKAREVLKWTPRYASWRDGFAAEFAVTESGPEGDGL